MFIDSHAHLDFDRFDEDREEVLTRAREAGVERVISIGTRLSSTRAAISLARAYPSYLSASAGFHPLSLEDDTEEGWATLIELAEAPEVVAIGETGLDYYYDPSQGEQQRISFRRHLKLSQKVNKPIIVHIRDAFQDVFEITAQEGIPAGGVVHCFTGGVEECERALALGYHISLSGIVTFKNAKNIQEAVPMIPLDRLLLETDSPYLAPTPHRGRRNEPAYVLHTAEVVSSLRGEPLETIANAATQNTYRLFNLKRSV
jgi:TatD DNase family protein